jgi:hypothetical protein
MRLSSWLDVVIQAVCQALVPVLLRLHTDLSPETFLNRPARRQLWSCFRGDRVVVRLT